MLGIKGSGQGSSKERYILATARSKMDKFFDDYPSWRLELKIWFGPSQKRIYTKNKPAFLGTCPTSPSLQLHSSAMFPSEHLKMEFDRSNPEWQSRVISMCLSEWASVVAVEVAGVIETFRGSVVWDHFVLTIE
jgi:hypothetical protein